MEQENIQDQNKDNNIEKYKPLFSSIYKPFKIIKNRNNDNTYKLLGATLTQFEKTIIFPFTNKRDEIFNSIFILFGKNYKKYIKNYFFPKRIRWAKKLIKGPMIVDNLSKPYIQKYIKSRLTDFPNMPIDRIMNKKDTIVDYSDILGYLINKNSDVFKKNTMKTYSSNLTVEIIIRLLYGSKYINEDYTSIFPYTSGLEIYSNSGKEPDFENFGFDRVIIPYKITLSNQIPLQINYFNGTNELTTLIKQNPDMMYDVGLILFLNKIINGEIYENNDPYFIIKNKWIDIFKEKNPIFYFYNSKFGFIFDIRQLKENMLWKPNRISKRFRELLTLLVRYNIGELNDEELDEIIEKEMDEDDIQSQVLNSQEINENKIIDFFKNNTISKKIVDGYNNLINVIINNSKANKEKRESFTKKASIFNSDQMDKLFSSLKDVKEENLDFESDLDESDPSINVKKGIIKSNDLVSTNKEEIDDDLFDNEEIDEIEINEEDEMDEEIQSMINEEDKKKEKFEDDIEGYEEIIENEENEIPVFTDDIQTKFFQDVKNEIKPQMSPKQILRFNTIKEKYKSIKFDEKTSIEDLINNLDATIIESVPMKENLIDDSFNNINIVDWENSYLEKTYKKDIVNCLNSFHDENKEIKFYMQDLKILDTSDQFNKKETIEVVYEDNNFNKHKLKFDIPKFDKNHRMTINGNSIQMKKQIMFLPVVKVAPDLVWLTSQFNKLYMERVDYTTNRSTHILSQLLFETLKDNPKVKIELGDALKFNHNYLTTIEYDFFSKKILSIIINPESENKYLFSFYQDELRKEIKLIDEKFHYTPDFLPIGIDYKNKKVIGVNIKDKYSSVGEIIIAYLLDSELDIDLIPVMKSIKIPKRKSYTRIMFMSKKIPTIIFLSYLWGLNKVIETAGIKVTISPKPIPKDTRSVIRFADAYLYYDYYPLENSFLLNGLNYMDTREIKISDMNKAEPYLEWLYQMYESRNIAKGWSDFKELFLDNITKEILKDMQLPTDLLELLLYCNELLGDNSFDHESDGDIENVYRIRCEEVVVETIYKCIASQIKLLRKAKDPTKMTISLPQDAVMAKLFKLTTFNNYDITNPINEMKQRGIVTFKGSTGTNETRAFTAGKRGYGSKYPGIIAMSSPDNYQVGITKQLTANPNITSTRGYLKTYKNKKEIGEAPASSLISLEEAAYPFAIDRDDPKRISYTSGQSVHGIKSKYAVPNMVRSPIDNIIAKCTTDTFAPKASKNGTVMKIDEKYQKIFVKYDDDTIETVKYGITYVTNSSYLLDINLKPSVKEGDKLKKGDVIAYDSDFFQKEGNELIYKQGPIAFLCIHESDSTEEDSSFISEEFALKMTTDVTNSKAIILSPNTNLISWKKIGDHVINEDPLMIFEYSHSDENIQIIDLLGEIDEETRLETMQRSPRAEDSGVITDIKVYWTIPLEDMTPSLRSFVEEYIAKVKAECNAEKKMTGRDSERLLELDISVPKMGKVKKYRVPDEGGVIVEYFTTHEQGMSIGDKSTNNTSIKSIIMDVVEQENAPYTESGLVLDGQISLLSIQARMVNSIYYTGLLSKLLFDFSKDQADFYFGDEK